MPRAKMFTGGEASRSWNSELDDFWQEELQRRPEVRILNKYAAVMAYIRVGLKGVGALALLWATVVLLGGFVSDLKDEDFVALAIIGFVQAAGLFDAMGDDRFAYFGELLATLKWKIRIRSSGKRHHGSTHHGRLWLNKKIRFLVFKIIRIIVFFVHSPVMMFTIGGPIVCVIISENRIAKQDDNASKANLKPALNIFYYISLAHGALCLLYIYVELAADLMLVKIVSRQYGLSNEVLDNYLQETKQMCVNNPTSTDNWNLITYGAGLLDSQLPEDCTFGGRVLTMLIDQDIPVPITWLLITSTRQRVQRLIGILAWRSPAEREMRWLAARIVEHLAGHLNLAQFPGALECISSLFDTSSLNNGDQEALHLPFAIGRSKLRKRKGFLTELLADGPPEDIDGNIKVPRSLLANIVGACDELVHKKFGAGKNGVTLEKDSEQMENSEGIDEDLVLPGLRILANLAHNRHNCTLIYNSKDLLSRVIAPVSSNKLVEDVKSNAAWTKIVDGSLKVLSRLMGSPGSTCQDMCSLITNDSNVVNNLEAILDIDIKSNSSIIELKIGAIEVLTQLVLHHQDFSAMGRREKLIERALHIFLTNDWMGDYLKDEKNKIDKPTTSSQQNTVVNNVNRASAKEKMAEHDAEAHVEKKMKKAKETAIRLKEKAGEALAMLSSDSEAIKSFTGCDNDLHRLTEFLDSKIKTIECKVSAIDTAEIEISTACRISAAVILRNSSNYVKEPTLTKVLAELLPIQAEGVSATTPRCWERVTNCIIVRRNDIENPSQAGQDKPSVSGRRSHTQKCTERRLQAELISLVATIRPNNNLDFAATLMSQTPPVALEGFVARLKRMVEDNMLATPACLAIQKLICKMVTELIPQDRNVEAIEKHNIIGALLKASKTMARFESRMIFAGVHRDCHGVDLRPLFSDLAKEAQDVLTRRKQELDINAPPARVP